MAGEGRQGFGSAGVSTGFGTGSAIYDETASKAIRAAHRRKWTLVGTIVFVVAVAAALLIYNGMTTSKEKQIARAWLAIDAEYNAITEQYQEKNKTAQPGPDDPGPDYLPVATKFAQFAKAHPSNPLGWQAALRAANIYFEKKQPASARELLEPLENKVLSNNLMQLKVRRALAGIYADAKEYDKALAEISYCEKLPDNPSINETKLFKAQVLYLAGKKDESAKLLHELSDNPLAALDPALKAVASEASMWLGYWGL